jgi:hypothetical protein
MGSWVKMETDFITNAKVGLAGANGDRVFLVMIMLHAKHGGGGIIPSSRCSPKGMRIEASAILQRISERQVAQGIEDCIAAGLLGRTERGDLQLCGFDEDHMPECSRCHQPNPEPGQSTCQKCRDEKKRKRRADAAGRSRADAGMPGPAAGQKRTANVLLDGTGQDGMGQDGTGQMDGGMDGGSGLSQEPERRGVRRRGPADAGAVAASVAAEARR